MHSTYICYLKPAYVVLCNKVQKNYRNLSNNVCECIPWCSNLTDKKVDNLRSSCEHKIEAKVAKCDKPAQQRTLKDNFIAAFLLSSLPMRQKASETGCCCC